MSSVPKQTAMFVLASEQLMPNVEAIYEWSRRNAGLDSLFIFHTADEERSAKPALRLERFCKDRLPGVKYCKTIQGDGLPQSVAKAWRQCASEQPESHWVLNATGGLKPMSAALMNLSIYENVEVIYRELASGWFHIRHHDGILASEPLTLTQDFSKDLQVRDLIELQIGLADGQQLSVGECLRLPATEIINHGCKTNWSSWPATFAECGHALNEKAGILFERLVASILLALGVKNICSNLIVHGAAGKSLLEVDVLAYSNHKLFVFDCKLRSDSQKDQEVTGSWIDQIQIAAERQRRLGGLNAQTVLIRPNSRATSDHRALAAAYKIEVIGPEEAFQLISILARLTNRPIPAELQEAEQKLLERRDRQNEPFAFSKSLLSRQGRSDFRGPLSIIEVENLQKRLRQERQQDWTGEFRQPVLKLQIPMHAVRDSQEVERALEYFGDVTSYKTNSKKSLVIEIRNLKSKNQLYSLLDRYPRAGDLLKALRAVTVERT